MEAALGDKVGFSHILTYTKRKGLLVKIVDVKNLVAWL